MTITEDNLFPFHSKEKEGFSFSEVNSLYCGISILCLDIFDDRYKEFLLPESFSEKSKYALQEGMKNFTYEKVQKNDVNFLLHVFNIFENKNGKAATIILLDWIRNAFDVESATFQSHIRSICWDVGTDHAPLRIQRLTALSEILSDRYDFQELDPFLFETKWDKSFYKLQWYDYYGDMENLFSPEDLAADMGRTLYYKIAWENVCLDPPDNLELKMIGDWVVKAYSNGDSEYADPQVLSISPILRAEYVRRGIIGEKFNAADMK